MVFEQIEKMIKNDEEFSLILLMEEISNSSSSSEYGYGEFNGAIIDAINDLLPGDPFALVCDNVIKFIEYKPTKKENNHYHSIKQKEVPINFSFSYHIIYDAFKKKDNEMVNFEFKRISNELDRLLNDPYSLCKKEEKGIAFAMCTYINESILLCTSTLFDGEDNEITNSCRLKLKELEKIFEID